MPSTYVHLAGKDYQEMLLELRGLKQKGERSAKPAIAPQTCKACQAPNMVTAKFCMRCRKPLTPEAEAEVRQRTRADLKEELAALVAATVKEQLAAEIQRVLGKNASNASNVPG